MVASLKGGNQVLLNIFCYAKVGKFNAWQEGGDSAVWSEVVSFVLSKCQWIKLPSKSSCTDLVRETLKK